MGTHYCRVKYLNMYIHHYACSDEETIFRWFLVIPNRSFHKLVYSSYRVITTPKELNIPSS